MSLCTLPSAYQYSNNQSHFFLLFFESVTEGKHTQSLCHGQFRKLLHCQKIGSQTQLLQCKDKWPQTTVFPTRFLRSLSLSFRPDCPMMCVIIFIYYFCWDLALERCHWLVQRTYICLLHSR